MTEKKLFYVWVFNRAAEDYEPISVHNTREEGEHALKMFEDEVHNGRKIGAVLEETFKEFTLRATGSRLGQIAPQLERLLAVIEDKPVGKAVTQDGRVVSLYGQPAFPIAIEKL